MPDFDSVEDLAEFHGFPFKLRSDQVEDVENLHSFQRVALFNEVGTGKTATATALCLAWDEQHNIILVPPVLQKQWERWLKSLKHIGSVVIYRGSPKHRRELGVGSYRWVIMTLPIFKNDFNYLVEQFKSDGRSLVGVVDEGHAIKNVGTANHKTFRDFFAGHRMQILTGTPIGYPGDAYSYVKLKTPNVYRSQQHFENLHIAEKDFFGNVVEWQQLELMNSNLMLQATRRHSHEVLKHLKEPNYIPIVYELDPEHMDLYNTLADEQLLLLPNGGKIDATTAGRLYNALQQIVCNWDYFSGDPATRSRAFDLLDAVADEIDLTNQTSSKLIVYTYYVMTSRAVSAYLQKFGAVALYSEVSARQQEANIDRFLNDPACRVMVAQPGSGGVGWNPQHVCWEALFLEEPVHPTPFIQAVGRLDRDGQLHVPNIRIAVAEGTIQRRLHDRLMNKDALANEVQGGFKDLQDAIRGL
jgi:SNF2 family DNA or RNA helicase